MSTNEKTNYIFIYTKVDARTLHNRKLSIILVIKGATGPCIYQIPKACPNCSRGRERKIIKFTLSERGRRDVSIRKDGNSIEAWKILKALKDNKGLLGGILVTKISNYD